MTLSVVATPGASNANSYVSVADADTYFEGRPFASAWTAADSVAKGQALVFATSLLDRERWAGAKGITYNGATTQALAWPRRWANTLESDAAPQLVSEYFIDTTIGFYSELTIPLPIVRATCELALEILKAGSTDPFTKDTTRNVRRKTIDVITTEYFAPGQRARGLAMFPAVLALIAPLLRGAQSSEIERV